MEDNKLILIKELNFWVPSVINVLGTNYNIKLKYISDNLEDSNVKLLVDKGFSAFCNFSSKTIVIGDLNDGGYFPGYRLMSDEDMMECYKETLRHELVHAFFAESGLKGNSHSSEAFASDEELIDFIAIQSPKMFKVFQECNIL